MEVSRSQANHLFYGLQNSHSSKTIPESSGVHHSHSSEGNWTSGQANHTNSSTMAQQIDQMLDYYKDIS